MSHDIHKYQIDVWLVSNRAMYSTFYQRPGCAPWILEGDHKLLVVGGPSGQDVVMDLILQRCIKEIIHSATNFRAGSYKLQGLKCRLKVIKFGAVVRGEVEWGALDEGVDYVILVTGYA